MKKIILSLFTIATIATNAQDMGFGKGNIAVTGSIGYTSVDNGTSKTTSFSVAPSAQYMINENIGLNGMIDYSTLTVGSAPSTNRFGFGVGANYYFMKGQFSPFLGARVNAYFPTNTTQIHIGLVPGVNYFLNKNWAINATLGNGGTGSGIGVDITSPSGGTSTTDFNLGLNLSSIGFGISYVFK